MLGSVIPKDVKAIMESAQMLQRYMNSVDQDLREIKEAFNANFIKFLESMQKLELRVEQLTQELQKTKEKGEVDG